MKKALTLLLACGMLAGFCGCQNNPKEVSLPDALPNQEAARELLKSGVEMTFSGDYVSTLTGKFVTYKVENETDAFNALSEVAELYGVKDAAAELKYDETLTGRVSTTYRFQQYYQDVRCVSCNISVFVDPDTLAVKYMNSSYLPDLDLSVTPAVTAEAAAETVKSEYSVTPAGEPELVIFTDSSGSALAWAVTTDSTDPSLVYIDAQTGSKLYAEKPLFN